VRAIRNAVAATVLFGIAVAAASCGIPDQGRPDLINGSQPSVRPSAVSRPATPSSLEIRAYFINASNQVVAVTRADPVATLSTAISALLAGPTDHESAGGISSAIPVGTKLNSAHQSGQTASLDFSDDLASVSGHEQLLAFAQIVLTADSVPGVAQVEVSIAGQAVNAPKPDGSLAQGPVTENDYRSLVAP